MFIGIGTKNDFGFLNTGIKRKKMLRDFGLIPAVADDFGHYLYLSPEQQDACQENRQISGWRKRIMETDQEMLSNVEVMDKGIGIYFMVEQMVKEDGKFRIVMMASPHCPDILVQDFEPMRMRLVLAIIQKFGLSTKVHTDFGWIGNVKYLPSDPCQRTKDLKLIRRVRAVLDRSCVLHPDARSLSVHSKIQYKSPYLELPQHSQKEKEHVARQLGDVSLVWQCGHNRRKRLREQHVYAWDDPGFEPKLSSMVYGNRMCTIKKMLTLEQTNDHEFDFPPVDDIRARFPYLYDPIDNLMFVDFETDYQKCIYLFGYYQSATGYQSVWSPDLDPTDEKELMHKIYEIVSAHKQNGGKVVYYFAEDRFWRERCKFHQLDSYSQLFYQEIDLHHVFERGPFLIRGVFDFKLKHIAVALYKLGKISIAQPEGCADGAESIQIARRWFSKQDPADKNVLEIYNEFDCRVLFELTRFLQNL